MICGMDILVLCGSMVSCVNFCWTIWMDGSTGTDVKRALTSNDVMVSPGCNLTCFMCSTKCCVFRWCEDWPTKGADDAWQHFGHPLLDTMDLSGCQLYGFWAAHKTWGGIVLVGYNFLYVELLSPSVCVMSLRVLMGWFLNLMVGSLLMVL